MGQRRTSSAIDGDRVTGGEEETRISGVLRRVLIRGDWCCRNPVHPRTGDIYGQCCAAEEHVDAAEKDREATNERDQGSAARTEGLRHC